MLNKLKNWIQARRDKKKQAQVAEQEKRYPINPFTDSTPFSSYSTYNTNIGGEETNGNRITSVDDVPEVYTPSERAALSNDSGSSSCDSGSSSCSCGD